MQRGPDDAFRSVGCVTGEEPAHRKLGSFKMSSKYLCSLFWRETLAFLYGAHGSGKQISHVFCYTKSPISSGRATYIITGTFYCNVRHSLTLQPQTHCSPAGAARFTFSGWFRLDLHTISLLWGFTLLWGNGGLFLRKHLKFLLRFILRARGIFQSNNIDHKNLCRFLGSVSPSQVIFNSSVKSTRAKRTQFSWESVSGEISLKRPKVSFISRNLSRKILRHLLSFPNSFNVVMIGECGPSDGQPLPFFLNRF